MGKQWKQWKTILGGSKITAAVGWSHETKCCFFFGRKAITNLDSIFGEGNGNLFQYSCLENPRDGGAWWAAVYGVTQSQTWQKRLSDLADSILKSIDITLSTKVRLVKAMVFPVVVYGCESWVIKKAERQRIDAFKLSYWRILLRVPWTARRSNQSVLKEISPEYSLKGLMLKLKL